MNTIWYVVWYNNQSYTINMRWIIILFSTRQQPCWLSHSSLEYVLSDHWNVLSLSTFSIFCDWFCLTLFQSTYAKLGCTQGWFLASLTHPPNRSVHVDPSLIAQRIYVFLLWFLGCCYPAEWIHEPSNIGPCCKFMKVNSGDICYTNKRQTWCYRAPTIVWPREGLVPLWIFYYRQAYLAYQEADSMAQTRDLWSHSNNSNQPITSTIWYTNEFRNLFFFLKISWY
jgi:hypothetical protein